jgi:hypothetical protein
MRKVHRFMLLMLLINFPALRLTAATPDSSAAPVPAAAATPAGSAKESSEGRVPIGVGVKVSTLGIGGDVAIAISHRSNVRFGFNAFSYGDTFNKDGVTYKGNLDLRSAQATYDMFLLKGFHISPGVLFYNGNQVSANASVRGTNFYAEQYYLCERPNQSHHGDREAYRVQGRANAAFGDWQSGATQRPALQRFL